MKKLPRAPFALLLLSLTPLLLAVSCLERQPPSFATSEQVVRGDWGGGIEVSETELLEFRLMEVEAVQTGDDSYLFEGNVYFGIDPRPGHIEGTATVDLRFEAAASSELEPQMQPPRPPVYVLTATLTGPDAGSSWQIEAQSDSHGGGHYGSAEDGAGAAHSIAFWPLGPRPHVMGLSTDPAELQAGEPFNVYWSGWAEEGQAVRCSLRSTAPETVEPSECVGGLQSVTMNVPVIDPPLSEPASMPVTLEIEWGEDYGESRSWVIEPLIVPAP